MQYGKPNLRWLEIDTTYTCGMRCHNCNRFVQLRPGSNQELVTVERIERLIRESDELEYPWRHWFLVGGEPTTHPELLTIIDRIAAYRDRCGLGNFCVSIATHGCGIHCRSVLRKIRQRFPFVRIMNSGKRGKVHHEFVSACVAPVDRFDDMDGHQYHGCSVSWHCGISLNYRGFYPCAVAGAIDRFFGGAHAIDSLADVTESAMREQYQRFCSLCGYYRDPLHCGTETPMSEAWRRITGQNRDPVGNKRSN